MQGKVAQGLVLLSLSHSVLFILSYSGTTNQSISFYKSPTLQQITTTHMVHVKNLLIRRSRVLIIFIWISLMGLSRWLDGKFPFSCRLRLKVKQRTNTINLLRIKQKSLFSGNLTFIHLWGTQYFTHCWERYIQTSLIWTPKGKHQASVFRRCLHYGDRSNLQEF